jgi:hypothetical protein
MGTRLHMVGVDPLLKSNSHFYCVWGVNCHSCQLSQYGGLLNFSPTDHYGGQNS